MPVLDANGQILRCNMKRRFQLSHKYSENRTLRPQAIGGKPKLFKGLSCISPRAAAAARRLGYAVRLTTHRPSRSPTRCPEPGIVASASWANAAAPARQGPNSADARAMPSSTPARTARYGSGRRLASAVLLGAAMAAAASVESPAQPRPPAGAAAPPARATAAEYPADPECLTVTQSSAATYMIANTACAEQSVLASIELANGGELARCFVKKIRTQISIASEGAAPVINYQCIEGAPGCSVEIVRDMFPECHAG